MHSSIRKRIRVVARLLILNDDGLIKITDCNSLEYIASHSAQNYYWFFDSALPYSKFTFCLFPSPLLVRLSVSQIITYFSFLSILNHDESSWQHYSFQFLLVIHLANRHQKPLTGRQLALLILICILLSLYPLCINHSIDHLIMLLSNKSIHSEASSWLLFLTYFIFYESSVDPCYNNLQRLAEHRHSSFHVHAVLKRWATK